MTKYEVIGYRIIKAKDGKEYRIAFCKTDIPFDNGGYNVGYGVAHAFVPVDVVIGDVISLYYVKAENRYLYIPS